MVTTYGLAAAPRNRVRVTSLGTTNGFDGFVPVQTLGGLTVGRNYAFVVSGLLGFFNFLNVQNSDLVAELRLGSSQGLYFSEAYRIKLTSLELARPQDRAASFQMIAAIPNWRGGDLQLRGRIWNRDNPQVQASFDVDGVLLQAWDLDQLGPANWNLKVQGQSTALERVGQGSGSQLTLTDPFLAAGNWISFFSTQIAPSAAPGPWNTWLEHLPTGAWGSPAMSWGLNGHGTRAFGGIAGRLTNLHQMGMVAVVDVQTPNIERIGIRGRQMSATGPQSICEDARVFSIRGDILEGFRYEQSLGILLYGDDEPFEEVTEWQLNRSTQYVVISSGTPAVGFGGKSVAHKLKFNRVTPISNDRDPLYSYAGNTDEGGAETRAGIASAFKGPAFVLAEGQRNPAERDPSIAAITGAGPRSRIVQVNTGSPGSVITFGDHGMQGFPLVQLSIPGRGFGVSVGNSRTLLTNLASPAWVGADIWEVDATFIRMNQAHGIAVGSEETIRVEGVRNSSPDLNGEHLARAVSDTVLRLPQTLQAGGSGGRVIVPARVYALRYRTLVGFFQGDGGDIILRSKETPGPEIDITEGFEGDAMGSLPELPHMPELPVKWEPVTTHGEIVNAYGEAIRWPTGIVPTLTAEVIWRLAEAEADSFLAWLRGLDGGAFRTTFPHEGPSAFVLTQFEIERDNSPGDSVASIRGSLARLEYLAP